MKTPLFAFFALALFAASAVLAAPSPLIKLGSSMVVHPTRSDHPDVVHAEKALRKVRKSARKFFKRRDLNGLLRKADISLTVHEHPNALAAPGLATLRSGSRYGQYFAEIHVLGLSAHPKNGRTLAGLSFDEDYFVKTVGHEAFTIHLDLIRRAHPDAYQLYEAPPFFVQGLPEWLSIRLLPEKTRSKIQAAYLARFSHAPERAFSSHYAGGAVIMGFIHQEFGDAAIQKLLHSKERAFSDSLKEATGLTLEELKSRWVAFARGKK
jgi:hypothetical protein